MTKRRLLYTCRMGYQYVSRGLFFFKVLLRMLCEMNMEWKGEMQPFYSRLCDMNDGICCGWHSLLAHESHEGIQLVRDHKSSLTAFMV